MRQFSLFDNYSAESIPVEHAAEELKVSVATIRNWIKTGYLEKIGRKEISISSFNALKNEVIGKDKLTQRANKSLKDVHDHDDLEKRLSDAIKNHSINSESLGDLYEGNLSESYKNREGIFYTPPHIVERFFDYLPHDCADLTFCDPCCGSGNFLVAAIKRGFKPSNVYGYDIDKTATEIAKKRLANFEGGDSANIFHRDFLNEVHLQHIGHFDVVFTNPPWGKKLAKHERDVLAKTLGSSGSKDTSAIFFFACLSILKKGGCLGLLLQDAFFNIATFENARQRALQAFICAFIDFGKPFPGLLTKAKGIILQKKISNGKNLIDCVSEQKIDHRAQEDFNKNPKSIFNFTCSSDESRVIDHLFDIQHITLKDNADYGLGIVTGNNNKYCVPTKREDHIPVYKGSDIKKSGLKPPSIFISNDLSLYQQVAPLELYLAKEKLIYKFISSELTFFHDVHQRFILNSANMLILHDDFPIRHDQLCALLNSKIMSWLFGKLFETHKILKSDIELLPIYFDYFKSNKTFSEKSFLDFLSIEESKNGSYRIKKQNM